MTSHGVNARSRSRRLLDGWYRRKSSSQALRIRITGERCMFTSGGNPPSLADCLAALLLLELRTHAATSYFCFCFCFLFSSSLSCCPRTFAIRRDREALCPQSTPIHAWAPRLLSPALALALALSLSDTHRSSSRIQFSRPFSPAPATPQTAID